MIEVRELQEPELLEAARMKALAWRQSYADLVPEDVLARQQEEDVVHRAAAEWASRSRSGERFWGIVRDGAVVGVAHSTATRDEDVPEPLELTMIYLLDSEKGRGTASRLLCAATNDAPCVVWVLAGNPRAIRFYEKHGFLADGAAKPAFRSYPDVREIRMVRRAG